MKNGERGHLYVTNMKTGKTKAIGRNKPMCDDEEIEEEKCRECYGTGQIRFLRDEEGRVNYVHGTFKGEMVECSRCQGEGIEL